MLDYTIYARISSIIRVCLFRAFVCRFQVYKPKTCGQKKILSPSRSKRLAKEVQNDPHGQIVASIVVQGESRRSSEKEAKEQLVRSHHGLAMVGTTRPAVVSLPLIRLFSSHLFAFLLFGRFPNMVSTIKAGFKL